MSARKRDEVRKEKNKRKKEEMKEMKEGETK